ncbi:MAG: 3-deoxy-manno-octulosonate cytidylyltransferase [Bdellovibrionota bacterium]
MSVCIVIPSRLGSTRLPEKALLDINGKPMVQHVYERACQVRDVSDVIVATDHEKIFRAVVKFGGEAVMTPATLNSGTDRVAAVARQKRHRIFVNVQGDEPMLDPKCVERCVELVQSGRFPITTPAAPLKDEAALRNPNVVKVLVAADERAVYFSRFPIPYSRGALPGDFSQAALRHHLGVYVYTREILLKFTEFKPSPWEAAESLEQLRALYYGIPIGVAQADHATPGVDTHEDLEFVRRAMLV